MNATKRYTQVVTTEDGGSAFEDHELELGEIAVGDGLEPMLIASLGVVDGAYYCTFGDFGSEPHTAANPQWVVVLAGELEVEVTDGTARRFGPSDLVLATDTSGRGHLTRAVGGERVHALGVAAVEWSSK
jgi:hypothetical protein